jgi:hypothetical protein
MSILTDQDLDQVNDLVHGLRDRMAYLNEEEKEDFIKHLEMLYNSYPSPVKVLYGYEAVKTVHR